MLTQQSKYRQVRLSWVAQQAKSAAPAAAEVKVGNVLLLVPQRPTETYWMGKKHLADNRNILQSE
jgi:hypothetical protein